jgi:hypothetical protein
VSLITAADNAQAWLLKAIGELEPACQFDGSSQELREQAEELAGELVAMHGAVERLYCLASDEGEEER